MGSSRRDRDGSMDSEQPSSSSPPQRGTIQWFLAAQQATQQQQPDPATTTAAAAARPFKQPRLALDVQPVPRRQQRPRATPTPHLALRSSNHCQQLLGQELGWRCPPSLNSWHQSQQLQLARVCLRTEECLEASASSSSAGFRVRPSAARPVSCLAVQQRPCGSSSSSVLAAVCDGDGILHVCRLSRLQAASASALNAAAALPPDVREALLDPARWAARATSIAGVPTGSGNIPTAAAAAGPGSAGVLTVQLQQQLRSCCWLQWQHNAATQASSDEGVLVHSTRRGVWKSVFAQGRRTLSGLQAKGGTNVEAAGTVVALDSQAAYQLAAVAGKALLLWDLRASQAAAATLPLQAAPAVLRALPQGQVLLSADTNGQVCLYDVRRLSNSSIVNFGSSRASQQLLATHNLRTRAAAAGFTSSSVAYSTALDNHFLCDVVVNPADPNLAAFIRPQLQAGLFDLSSGQVLQQVSLLQHLVAGDSSHDPFGSSSSSSDGLPPAAAGGQGCWDSSGRVLYTQGLLQYAAGQPLRQQTDAGGAIAIAIAGRTAEAAAAAAPSLAAVDFGSWHGRKQRWAIPAEAGGGSTTEGGGGEDSSSSERAGRPLRGGGGRLHVCQGGQVVHRELHWGDAPTVLTAADCGGAGEMLAGTLTGQLLWLGL